MFTIDKDFNRQHFTAYRNLILWTQLKIFTILWYGVLCANLVLFRRPGHICINSFKFYHNTLLQIETTKQWTHHTLQKVIYHIEIIKPDAHWPLADTCLVSYNCLCLWSRYACVCMCVSVCVPLCVSACPRR